VWNPASHALWEIGRAITSGAAALLFSIGSIILLVQTTGLVLAAFAHTPAAKGEPSLFASAATLVFVLAAAFYLWRDAITAPLDLLSKDRFLLGALHRKQLHQGRYRYWSIGSGSFDWGIEHEVWDKLEELEPILVRFRPHRPTLVELYVKR
jgi:hypothetical protein